MYISKSIIEGLKILAFDKQTIKKTAREKTLEEIFLTTLFLNYLIMLIAFIFGLLKGGYYIEGKMLNPSVLYAIMLIYPFFFNLGVYVVYGFFGIFAELVNPKKRIKPLLAVGFHSSIVFSIVFYIIALTSTLDLSLGIFLIIAFSLYFLYSLFISMHHVYGFSAEQSLISVILPFLLLGFGLYTIFAIFPTTIDWTIELLFK